MEFRAACTLPLGKGEARPPHIRKDRKGWAGYFCRMEKLSMDQLNRKTVDEVRVAAKAPVVMVLENVRSAYNVGSAFRTADAFLIEGLWLCGYTAFPPHKEISKTALGAEESVTWKHFKKTADAIAQLKAEGYKVYAVEQTTTAVMLNELEAMGEKIAVVFGNEVTGVEQETILACDGCVEIPQWGTKHSLNVAVAAGVVLWELVRGRKLN